MKDHKLKILITNHNLANRAGTQLYVRDIALELQKRGHSPFVYSPVLGDVAKELRQATIPVVSCLDHLSIKPDIIHGHHYIETLAALLHFPSTPALYVCHGWFGWQELPPHYPRILRYLAIDQLTYHRLVVEGGIAENKIRILRNFVDLGRFKCRTRFSTKPRKALVYSSYIDRDGSCFKTMQEACKEAQIEVDLVGYNGGNPTPNPEKILLQYDIVFAVGRSALEALATGASVIVYSGNKIGPLVTTDNFERLRRTNFGLQALDTPATHESIVLELKKYANADMPKVYDRLKKQACQKEAVDALFEHYQEVLQTSFAFEPELELKALGKDLHRFSTEFSSVIKQIDAERQKIASIVRLYQRLLKIPFAGRLIESLRKKWKT